MGILEHWKGYLSWSYYRELKKKKCEHLMADRWLMLNDKWWKETPMSMWAKHELHTWTPKSWFIYYLHFKHHTFKAYTLLKHTSISHFITQQLDWLSIL